MLMIMDKHLAQAGAFFLDDLPTGNRQLAIYLCKHFKVATS